MIIPGSNCCKNTWRTLSNTRTCPNIDNCRLRLMLNLGPPFDTVRCEDWYWPWDLSKKVCMPKLGCCDEPLSRDRIQDVALLSYLLTKWNNERQKQQAKSATAPSFGTTRRSGWIWAGGIGPGANEGRNTSNGIMEGRKTKQDRTRYL
jgi:hypothetical protein